MLPTPGQGSCGQARGGCRAWPSRRGRPVRTCIPSGSQHTGASTSAGHGVPGTASHPPLRPQSLHGQWPGASGRPCSLEPGALPVLQQAGAVALSIQRGSGKGGGSQSRAALRSGPAAHAAPLTPLQAAVG